jgi:hypothetical protein
VDARIVRRPEPTQEGRPLAPVNAAGPLVSATFTLTRAEHGRAFDDLHPLIWWQLVPWITQPGGRAQLRARIWMGGVLLVVVGFPLLFVRAYPKVALVGPLLVACGFVWMMLLRALRRRAALSTYDRSPELQREQRWLLTADGLEITYAGEDPTVSKLPWREVLRIEETRDGFGFVVSLQRTGFLPRRAVREDDLPALRARLTESSRSRDA